MMINNILLRFKNIIPNTNHYNLKEISRFNIPIPNYFSPYKDFHKHIIIDKIQRPNIFYIKKSDNSKDIEEINQFNKSKILKESQDEIMKNIILKTPIDSTIIEQLNYVKKQINYFYYPKDQMILDQILYKIENIIDPGIKTKRLELVEKLYKIAFSENEDLCQNNSALAFMKIGNQEFLKFILENKQLFQEIDIDQKILNKIFDFYEKPQNINSDKTEIKI